MAIRTRLPTSPISGPSRATRRHVIQTGSWSAPAAISRQDHGRQDCPVAFEQPSLYPEPDARDGGQSRRADSMCKALISKVRIEWFFDGAAMVREFWKRRGSFQSRFGYVG